MASLASALRRVLWNDRERRPRAPWRLVLGGLLLLLVGLAAALPWALVGALDREVATAGDAVLATTAQVAVYVALTAGLIVAALLVDRRTPANLGLGYSRAWWRDLGFGVALGVAMPALVFAVEFALGYVAVTGTLVARSGTTLPPSAGGSLVLSFALTAGYFVGVAVLEEVLFRGYLLPNVAEGLRAVPSLGPRGAALVAAGVTSVLFGLGHATNPGASPLAVLTITLYGGLLAASFLLTGRVAVAVGVHWGWNLAVSSVFGFPVSGVATPATLLAVEQSGPALVTGGAFGPEAGLISLVALAAGSLALAGWVRRGPGGAAALGAIATPDLRAGDRGGEGSDGDPPDGGE